VPKGIAAPLHKTFRNFNPKTEFAKNVDMKAMPNSSDHSLQEIYVTIEHGILSYISSLEYAILLGYDCALLGNQIQTLRTKNVIFNLTSVKPPLLQIRRYWQLSSTGGPVISVMLFVRTNIYSRVSFSDGLFYDDSLLRPVSSRTDHCRLVVHHCRNSSVLYLLSALLAIFRCAYVFFSFFILLQFF
jgi:hypothetical protein